MPFLSKISLGDLFANLLGRPCCASLSAVFADDCDDLDHAHSGDVLRVDVEVAFRKKWKHHHLLHLAVAESLSGGSKNRHTQKQNSACEVFVFQNKTHKTQTLKNKTL
jgi:hypothetical protein